MLNNCCEPRSRCFKNVNDFCMGLKLGFELGGGEALFLKLYQVRVFEIFGFQIDISYGTETLFSFQKTFFILNRYVRKFKILYFSEKRLKQYITQNYNIFVRGVDMCFEKNFGQSTIARRKPYPSELRNCALCGYMVGLVVGR